MRIESIDGSTINLVKEIESEIEAESVFYFYQYDGELYYNLIIDTVLANRNILFLINWAQYTNLDELMNLLSYSSKARDNNKCLYRYEIIHVASISKLFVKLPTMTFCDNNNAHNRLSQCQAFQEVQEQN